MLTGVLLALGSALVWGSGDFCGGRASTKLDAFQVLGLSALSGLAILALLTVVAGERVVLDGVVLPAIAAGVSTSVGIACLYRGLSLGSAAVVAPTAAVVAAVIPVLYSAFTDGMPGPMRSIGFVLALAGIYLVSRAGPGQSGPRREVRLGVLAGFGFGGFLVLIAQVPEGAVFVPLAISRSVMFVVSVGLLVRRGLAFPSPAGSPLGLVAGVFDASGTAFYLLAQEYVRLDVAAVLSSLYPAATVMLARVITLEQITATQWVGASACVLAVAFIAM